MVWATLSGSPAPPVYWLVPQIWCHLQSCWECTLVPSPRLLTKTLNCYTCQYSSLRDCASFLASSWTLLITTLWASSPASFPLTLFVVPLFSLYLTKHSLYGSLSQKPCSSQAASTALSLSSAPVTSGLKAVMRFVLGKPTLAALKQLVILVFRNGFWRESCGVLCLKFSSEVLKDVYKLRQYLAPFFYICWLSNGNNFQVEEGNN